MFVYKFTLWITVAMDSGVRLTVGSMGRKRRMTVLHKALQILIAALQNFELKSFLGSTRG